MKNKNISLSLRKVLLSALVAAPLATLPSPVWGLPNTTNMTSSAGASTTTTKVGTSLSITTPDKSILTWTGANSFDIASGDNVMFTLPGATSSVLNRVNSPGVITTIDGTLTSNGKVFVLNPAGITIGANAIITTAGFGLSTIDEPDFNFSSTGTLSLVAATAPTGNIIVTAGANQADNRISVGSSGSVLLAANNVSFAGTIDAGTLNVVSKNSNGAQVGVTIGGAAGTRVGGSLAAAASRYGVLNIKTAGSDVDLTSGAGDVIVGGNLSVTETNGGDVGQSSTGVLKIGDSNAAATLAITTTGTTNGGVGLTSVTGNGQNLGLTLNTGAASVTFTGAGKDLKVNASNVSDTLDLTSAAGAGSITSGGASTVTGVITLANSNAGKTTEFVTTGDASFAAIVADNANASTAVNLTSGGTLTTAGVTGTKVSLKGAGNVAQTGAVVSSGTLTVESTSGKVDLTGAGNLLADVVVKTTPKGAKITEDSASGLRLAKGTAATGDVTITTAGGAIALGAASGDSVSVTGKLALDTTNAGGTAAGANITDGSDNITVTDTLTMTAGTAGNITLDGGSTGATHLTALKSSYGQVNIVSAVDATVYEQAGLNLGKITLGAGGDLVAYSSTAISNSGQLIVPGTTTVGAGTGALPGVIALDFTDVAGSGNQLTGAISFLDDLGTIGSASVGNYLVSSFSVVSETSPTLAAALDTANLYGNKLSADISLKSVGAAVINTAVPTTGNLTLASNTGNITITGGSFKTVTVTSKGGNIAVTSGADLMVNGTLTASAGTPTASFTTSGNLTINNYVSNYDNLTTFKTTANKAIKDNAPGISIYGAVKFDSAGSVSVTNSGHNFGGVAVTTGANGAASITESGTLKLTDVSINNNGSLTATSTNGDVIQAAGTAITSKTVTAKAASGKVTLDSATNAIDTLGITAAAGDVTVVNNKALALSDITTTGKLSVTTGNTFGITQASNAKLNVYDTVTLVSGTTGVVTIGNTGNRLGAVYVKTGSGAVTVKEQTTLNLRSVATTGNVTATSEGGSIITTTATMPAGFTNSLTGANGSFTAAGDVLLTLGSSDFAGIALNAGGNASFTDSAANLVVNASTIKGTLDLTATAGNITQGGVVKVDGNTTLSAAAGGISLNDSNNTFGGLRFTAGAGGVVINELTSMKLRGGSFSTGPVALGTGGDFITEGPGGTSINNTLSITATGTIIPGAGSLLVTQGMTVYSNNTKDLSALSKSGSLNGIDPVNLGTGAYTAPGQ